MGDRSSICRQFRDTGFCKFDKACKFSHSVSPFANRQGNTGRNNRHDALNATERGQWLEGVAPSKWKSTAPSTSTTPEQSPIASPTSSRCQSLQSSNMLYQQPQHPQQQQQQQQQKQQKQEQQLPRPPNQQGGRGHFQYSDSQGGRGNYKGSNKGSNINNTSNSNFFTRDRDCRTPTKPPPVKITKPAPFADESWKRSYGKDNFRFASISPTPEDINTCEYPDPPTNIVTGSYDSLETYLDVQFRLFRADCILPIRKIILDYRDGAVDDSAMTIYKKVRVVSLLYASMGLVHRVSFMVDGRRVNWKTSKRLLPGNIVCLSQDHFQTFRFAIVMERDYDLLLDPRDLQIGIKFMDQQPELDFDADARFVMIEAFQGYFEAYRHVLKCLQNINPHTLPFRNQIAHLDFDDQGPTFSQNVQVFGDQTFLREATVRFSHILKDRMPSDQAAIMELTPADTSEVRERVCAALYSMLTREMSLIQGPPGTGKTYLGLVAVHTLLTQCKTSNLCPIIVICQTNHALDQFLAGVLTFEQNIARLGSRSKDEQVMKKTLFNIREDLKTKAREKGVPVVGVAPVRYYQLKRKIEHDMLTLLEELSVEYIALDKLLENYIISQTQRDSFASDEWIITSSSTETEVPTVKPWLESAPRVTDPDVISGFDDTLLREDDAPEEEAEVIEEIVEEFQAAILDDTRLFGNQTNLKKSIVYNLEDEDVATYLSLQNVYDIPSDKRLLVYKVWRREYLRTITKELGKYQCQYDIVCENIKAQLVQNDKLILKNARVIGMTTTAASKYHDLLYLLQPKVILCEEASEAFEAHVIAALTPSVQQFILIGDHEQLRPSVSVDELKIKNIDMSLFERMVRNKFPFVTLDCQRRMRPDIRNMVSHIYPNLTDHESVLQYGNVRGFHQNLFFLSHDEPESHGDGNSFVNKHEAAIVARLTRYLLQQGYQPNQITLLTMYAGQKTKIHEKLRALNEPECNEVRVSTVDGFQGEESDIIILSLVRSNKEGKIGFLSSSNRMCVALSRAKVGMYILGDGQLMSESRSVWSNIFTVLIPPMDDPSDYLIGNKLLLRCTNHPDVYTEVYMEADFDNVREGGCSLPCDQTFEKCGHPCPFTCHTRPHSEIVCQRQCNRRLSCDHLCHGICGEVCRLCTNESCKLLRT